MNKKFILSFFIICLLILIATTSGCLGATKVGDLLNNPESYNGKTVTVEGTTTAAFRLPSALEGYTGVYGVKDDSGEIAVLTKGALPKTGEKVSVNGEFRANFFLRTTSKKLILESSRR